METRKRLPAAQRRRQLLEAARHVFGKKGYRRAEINEVAEGAGVTRPLLYRFFPGGKRDVFLEVLGEHLDSLMASLTEAMGRATDPRERLRQGFDAYARFAEENPEGFFLLMQSSADSEVGDGVMKVRRRIVDALSEAIASEMKGSGLVPRGAPIYAHAVLGSVESAVAWWCEERSVDRATLVSYLLAFVWRGFDGLPRDPAGLRPGKDRIGPQRQRGGAMNENGELIRKLYDAFAKADLDTIRESIGEDAVVQVAGQGSLAGSYKGRDEILGLLAEFISRSEGTFKAEPHDILASSDHVVVLSDVTASRGDKKLSTRGVEVFHVRDGKIAEGFFTGMDIEQLHDFFG